MPSAPTKRFYQEAVVVAAPACFSVALDGWPVRSPGREPLELPTRPLAELVAAEWNAQQDTLDPESMPMTRFANSAIDRIRPRRDRVVDEIAGYAETDLLCYRVDTPDALVERQNTVWQPLLDWLAARHGASLGVTRKMTPLSQDAAAVSAVRAAIALYDDFALSALHGLTATSGSVVLALAVAEGRIGAEEAAAASLLDETYQAENWGEDPETTARWQAIRAEIAAAAKFLASAAP